MIGGDGWDHFDDEGGYNYDDAMLDLRLPPQVSVVLTPETGHLGIIGQAAIVEVGGAISTSGTSFATPKIIEQLDPPEESFNLPAVEEPADLLWTPIARMIMSPTRFREEWSRHISDMNYERREHLKRGNLFGAHLAVIRAHFYSLPVAWLLIPVRFMLHLLRHWLGI
jgi:hypothetical protein